MIKRYDILNHLARKYKLERYLEIGQNDPTQNFDKIICKYKVSVDPDPNAHATFCKTSDEYFSNLDFVDNEMGVRIYRLFDLVFIDGLHEAQQVKKDFENALKILSPNGFIVLHDCNPEKEEHTIVPRPTKTGHWNGDVYRFAAGLNYPKTTVDIDNGCMVIPNRGLEFNAQLSSWFWFAMNRKELLNLISWEEFVSM